MTAGTVSGVISPRGGGAEEASKASKGRAVGASFSVTYLLGPLESFCRMRQRGKATWKCTRLTTGTTDCTSITNTRSTSPNTALICFAAYCAQVSIGFVPSPPSSCLTVTGPDDIGSDRADVEGDPRLSALGSGSDVEAWIKATSRKLEIALLARASLVLRCPSQVDRSEVSSIRVI